jgi:uncharacterized protein YndB with AHSA1/START domain
LLAHPGILDGVVIDLKTTVEISRPVAEVFAFVADHTNAPRWQNGLSEVRRLTDGPLGVGTEHEFIRRFAGRKVATRNRFVAYEEARYVEFEIPAGWLTGRASYLTEPSRSDTVLTSRMQFYAHGPLALLEPMLTRLLARDCRRDEACLKRLLEHEAA